MAGALRGQPVTVLRRDWAHRAAYWFEWLSRAAAIRVYQARPVIVGGRVVGVVLLSRPARSLFAGLYEDAGKITTGVLIILLLLVMLSGLLSRGITRPIERLGAATRTVAAGRGEVPEIPTTAAIEIQGLYADFAAMAAAIERRSRYLRDVAHAISHEFKTPLAGIRGAIELLQDHGPGMVEAERARFLSNAAVDTERLTQLIARLLDLARADLTRAKPGETTDVSSLLARLADAHSRPGFIVECQLLPGLRFVAMPEPALETVLATLLENSRQAGATRVTVDVPSGPGVTLVVTDDGPGMAPADVARAFEPFFTTRRAAGGTGLGLTIARSLLDAHGGCIAICSSEAGVCVEMELPPSGSPGRPSPQ